VLAGAPLSCYTILLQGLPAVAPPKWEHQITSIILEYSPHVRTGSKYKRWRDYARCWLGLHNPVIQSCCRAYPMGIVITISPYDIYYQYPILTVIIHHPIGYYVLPLNDKDDANSKYLWYGPHLKNTEHQPPYYNPGI